MAAPVPPPGDRLQICFRRRRDVRIERGVPGWQSIKPDSVFDATFHRHMCVVERDALAEFLCENRYIFVPGFDRKKPPPAPAGLVLGKWALLGLVLLCLFIGAMVHKFGEDLLRYWKTMFGSATFKWGAVISIGTVSGIGMAFVRKVWDWGSENAAAYVGVGLKNMILKFLVKVARAVVEWGGSHAPPPEI